MNRIDTAFMLMALAEARKAGVATRPNPRVGCVIVRDGRVVGRGHTQRAFGGDHAEVGALREAAEAARGATAYVTLEPCAHHGSTPPCADALVRAGVARVVGAMTDPFPGVAGAGFERLRAAGIAVTAPLLAAEAEALCPGFFQRMRSGRPRVTVKLAASLDGRTALANGVSQWITGEAARADVQRLRAGSCAIVTGSGTVLADDPRLTVRGLLPDGLPQPLRVVLDSAWRTPPDAALFGEDGAVLVVGVAGDAAATARADALQAAGAEVLVCPAQDGRPALQPLLDELARRQCNEVLVEAGATVSGAVLAAGLCDRLVLYQAGVVLGSASRGLLDLPVFTALEDAPRLVLQRSTRLGPDWRLDLAPV